MDNPNIDHINFQSKARANTMELNLETIHTNYIKSFEPGKILVGNHTYTQNILITSDTVSPWRISDLQTLDTDSQALDALLQYQSEVVILGTGQEHIFPKAKFIYAFHQRGIGIEVMPTSAACRTFNLLAADKRRVLAALIIPPPLDL